MCGYTDGGIKRFWVRVTVARRACEVFRCSTDALSIAIIIALCTTRTGKRLYQERLGSGTSAFTASPVANNGRIYFTSEGGDVYVVRAGAAYELRATNKLDAVSLATPAISEGMLYFRTSDTLMASGSSQARR
jgi:outer membrane protein assembly factor BamB